jgi:phosphate starvation-inducible PhoH-like protein
MELTEKKLIFEDIDLLSLFGMNDANIKIIENRFKTNIVVRGNTVILKGSDSEINKIESIFKEMAYMLRRNKTLNEHDVKTVIDLIDVNSNTNKKSFAENIIFNGEKDIIRARTPKQIEYFEKSKNNDLVFSIGPAGTGKTFLAVAMALSALRNNLVSRLIISRPAVEAGESLGYLPGDLKEKIDPYLRPIMDALRHMLNHEKLKTLMERQTIEITPLAYMRGRTLSNAFIILDEAQNATSMQMKMFLTRLGMNSKAIITGDVTQIDLQNKKDSGLINAKKILSGIDGIEFVYFDNKDVVRHKLVSSIIKAYELEESKKRAAKNK